MGFLDNTTITVDAILTKKGREKLARDGDINITHYAFADDEIDYSLIDVSHPNGSSFYGAVLENMPLLEAFVDETQVMRYKLFTADKDLSKLSSVKNVDTTPYVIELNTDGPTIQPNTDTDTEDRYDFLLLNKDVANMVSLSGKTGSFTRDGKSQLIRDAQSIRVTATDRSGDTNPILKTVIFITSRNTGATTSAIIHNNSTGAF